MGSSTAPTRPRSAPPRSPSAAGALRAAAAAEEGSAIGLVTGEGHRRAFAHEAMHEHGRSSSADLAAAGEEEGVQLGDPLALDEHAGERRMRRRLLRVEEHGPPALVTVRCRARFVSLWSVICRTSTSSAAATATSTWTEIPSARADGTSPCASRTSSGPPLEVARQSPPALLVTQVEPQPPSSHVASSS